MTSQIFFGKALLILSLVFCWGASQTAYGQSNPNGSRYDNWTINAVWSPHYGQYTDGGWVSSKYPRMLGDVNGDGMQDVVAYGEDGVYVSLSNGTSFVGISMWINNFGYQQAWRVGVHPRYVVDVNGDGKDDVVGFGIYGIYVAISDGTKFINFKLWTSDFGASSNPAWSTSNEIRLFADVNGDGAADAVGFGTDGVYVGISDPANSRFLPMAKWSSGYGYNTGWRIADHVRVMGDVNGDGKADVVGFGNAGTYVSIAGNGSFGSPITVSPLFGNNSSSGGWNNTDYPRMIGDVNGDGKQDLVGFASDGVDIALSLGAQPGWTQIKVSNQFGYNEGWRTDRHIRLVTDVNGDGKADVVGFSDTGTSFAVQLGEANGYRYSQAQQWINDFGYNQAWRIFDYPRFMADVNGDGRPEPVGYGYYGVYVSPSASMYCCDSISFLDTGGNNQQVNGAIFARAYLPRSEIIIPAKNNPDNCSSNPTYKDDLLPVVSNGSFGKPPWSTYYTPRLMMNANFFDIGSGNPNDPNVKCTNALGWTISNTQTYSTFAQVHGGDTQTLVFYTPQSVSQNGVYAAILSNSQVTSQRSNIQNAVSGFTLLTNGVIDDKSTGLDPTNPRARSAIGISKDGKTLILLVVNDGCDGCAYPTGGSTIQGMGSLMLGLGAWNALTLDGSGSAQLGFNNGAAVFHSTGSDGYAGYSHLYRAVPVFIGVR